MDPYALLCEHHAKHVFKRGANSGDAPLDRYNRYAHKLIKVTPTHADIVLYRTTIFRAYPDGSVVLNTNGHTTQLTMDTLNNGLGAFVRAYTGRVFSKLRFGTRQLHYYTNGRSYAYYDHMRILPDGTPAEPAPFVRYSINRSMSRPFSTQAKEFRAMFPVLFAALPDTIPDDAFYAGNTPYLSAGLYDSRRLAEAITTNPELWHTIVHSNAYSRHTYKDPRPGAALDRILKAAKAHMYHITVTGITCI